MTRCILYLLLAVLLLPAAAPAQKKKKKKTTEDGLYPPVILDNTKNKKETTQTLPPERELPTAAAGEAGKLIFQISPLSGRGLLSQQARDALRELRNSAHGATILHLRAFVAGTGDMRRVGEIIGELWPDRGQLPSLSVVQTGGLPLEGAQVLIESIAEDHKTVNPNGLAFISGQPADSLTQSLSKMEAALHGSSMANADVVRVTCWVRSLDENKDAPSVIAAHFANAAAVYVQAQREYLPPIAQCEGVARAPDVVIGSGNKAPPGAAFAGAATRLVFSGEQLGFGTQDGDVQLALDRLEKSLAPFNAQLKSTVMSHIYVLERGLAAKVKTARPELFEPKASTVVQVEGLPSIDASLGVDVIAAADYTKTVRADSVRTTGR